MAIGSSSRQNPFAIKEEKLDSWDPFLTLGIINTDTRTYTCVGFAPSKGRRCQNRIAGCNQNAAFAILQTLRLLSPSSSKIGPMLPEIASLLLCRAYHQNQVDSVAVKWQAKISSLRVNTIRTKSWRVYEDPDPSTIRTLNLDKTASSQPRQPFSEKVGEKARTPNKNSRPSTFDEQRRSEKEYHERKEREQYKEEERRKEEKKKQEEQEQEKREEERKKQQEEENLRKEQERKEKEQRDRAAHNERIRQAAQKKREEQARQTQEQAAKEKKEWKKSWTSFTSRWATFTEANPPPATKETIPWPVKSGRYADLTASTVRDFFLNACPDAGSPARMHVVLQAECLKWHPDRAPRLFPGFAEGLAEREVLRMICRVVIDMKKEENKKRQAACS